MRRRRVAVLVAAVVLLVGVAVTAFILATRSSTTPPVSPAQARAVAVIACQDAAQVQQLIARDASIADVKAALARAVAESDRAARGDPTWFALSGGLKSVRIALDADDARVARTGIDVVRTECERVGP